MELSPESRVLFIGDSITDCSWRTDSERIGNGYVRMVRDHLAASAPERAPVVLNRGISGNKITDLSDRWQSDVLDLKPDVLSIKIGINDVWHGLAGNDGGVPLGKFEAVYDEVLARTRGALPGCVLVLCEPSVIWPPQPAEGNSLIKGYVAAVHRLAAKHGAECVVPLHEAFEHARARRSDIAWAPDGVHPSSTGHMLIALTWLKATALF